jgi:hypothetical protein
MTGYKFNTEEEAINARSAAATYAGFPVPGGETLYWVDFQFSELDNFYYIQHVEGLENVLGEAIEFEITLPATNE